MDLKRFHRGDRAYLESVVRTHAQVVMGVARRFGKDPDHTNDLFQESWMHIFQKRATYRGEGSIQGWLHRVATRVCITDFRNRRNQASALNRMGPGDGPQGSVETPQDEQKRIEEEESYRQLHLSLGELSDREHEAIYLRFMEDKSTAEVASMMGIQKMSVRSIIRHGVKRLRIIMGS